MNKASPEEMIRYQVIECFKFVATIRDYSPDDAHLGFDNCEAELDMFGIHEDHSELERRGYLRDGVEEDHSELERRGYLRDGVEYEMLTKLSKLLSELADEFYASYTKDIFHQSRYDECLQYAGKCYDYFLNNGHGRL